MVGGVRPAEHVAVFDLIGIEAGAEIAPLSGDGPFNRLAGRSAGDIFFLVVFADAFGRLIVFYQNEVIVVRGEGFSIGVALRDVGYLGDVGQKIALQEYYAVLDNRVIYAGVVGDSAFGRNGSSIGSIERVLIRKYTHELAAGP